MSKTPVRDKIVGALNRRRLTETEEMCGLAIRTVYHASGNGQLVIVFAKDDLWAVVTAEAYMWGGTSVLLNTEFSDPELFSLGLLTSEELAAIQQEERVNRAAQREQRERETEEEERETLLYLWEKYGPPSPHNGAGGDSQ